MKKALLIPLALVVVFVLWYEFRPEKLFINKRVNEPAPALPGNGPMPLFTGRFANEGQRTTGRATILWNPDGSKTLHLADFHTNADGDAHVLLVKSTVANLGEKSVLTDKDVADLGALKSMQGDQDYAVQVTLDLNQFNTAVIYNLQTHTSLGIAKLENF